MKLLNTLKKEFRYLFCKINYKKKLKQIRKNIKHKKARVLFYVTENQKWGYQSLYKLFEKSNKFEPFIIVSILANVHKGIDKTRNNLEENYLFFKSRKMNVEYGYKNGNYIDLKEFKPDIIFYEQQWGLPQKHRPYQVSKYALTCYCPYSFQIFKNFQNYYKDFYRYLYRYYLTCELNLKFLKKEINSNINNCKVVGYPKLDVYLEQKNIEIGNIWKHPEKIKIIYAPHHSFEENSLNLATFKENGQLILKWAESHPETTWVFKPHPRFKFALLRNKIMTEKEIENYYKKWEEIGNIYTQGDYFDIFKTSDLMITDCGSFLAEYLPTLKPLIRPTNKNSIELNDIGKCIISEYYQTTNNKELLKELEELIVNKNDYKKNNRKIIYENLFKMNKNSAFKIYSNLTEIINFETEELSET